MLRRICFLSRTHGKNTWRKKSSGWVWPTKLWCSITINSTTVICSAFYGNVAPAPFVDDMVDHHAANFQHLVVVPTTTSICCSKHNCVCKKGMQKTISHSSCLKIHRMIHNILNSQWFFSTTKNRMRKLDAIIKIQPVVLCSLGGMSVFECIQLFRIRILLKGIFVVVQPHVRWSLKRLGGQNLTCKNSMKYWLLHGCSYNGLKKTSPNWCVDNLW